MSEPSNIQREFGIQPIDKLLNDLNYNNKDVVGASTEQITHKMISRARKGRLLTRNVQRKILNAINNLNNSNLTLTDLFNYRGK